MKTPVLQRRNALILLAGMVLVLLACKSKPEHEPKLGELVKLDDSQWQVIKADVIGATIQGMTGVKKTGGKFLKIEFTVVNTGKEDETILDHPKVIDDQGREFGPLDDQSLYMGENESSMTLESLPPSIMKRFWAIYELPADSKGLKFEARALAAFGEKKKVALGI